jgi:hypothetical protein
MEQQLNLFGDAKVDQPMGAPSSPAKWDRWWLAMLHHSCTLSDHDPEAMPIQASRQPKIVPDP